MSSYSQGENTLQVPMELFALNRRRLCSKLKETKTVDSNSVVVLQGGVGISIYDTDREYLFRQESFFHWAFGVLEPDFFGVIEIESGSSHLFIPHFPESYGVWMGKIYDCEHYKKKYAVDHVHYVKKIEEVLKELNAEKLLILKGLNTDSDLQTKETVFEGISGFQVDKETLHPVISECRVIKTELELDVLRYVCRISSDAHVAVMKAIRPGMKEYQGEAVFLHHSYFNGGCRHASYTCICGSGENGSILHYGHAAAPNDKTIKDGDMCLFDMGAEYFCYASDITCSFPVNGKFTEKQKNIYNAVLKANQAVIQAAKPGVSWVNMHLLSNRVMLQELLNVGILQGKVDDMMKANLGATFQPHGLGHFMGLDVHDVGGYLEDHPPRPTRAGLKSLRTARVLQAGMVITVEPGCYFIQSELNKALADPELSPFFVKDVIDEYRSFGGVRIEDDIIITKDGVELMSIVPRSVEEIESIMAQGRQ